MPKGHTDSFDDAQVEKNSETLDHTENDIVSEMDSDSHNYDGSYQQYKGDTHHHVKSSRTVPQYDEPKTYVYTERDENTEHHYSHHPSAKAAAAQRESLSSVANSFDQVVQEAAEDLQVYDEVTEVDDGELNDMAETIPERNQDRLLSGHEADGQTFHTSARSHADVHQLHHEEIHEEQQHYEHHEEEHHYEHDPETEVRSEETIGPPPSFAYRSERLSRNVSDAMANIWDRFWSDDVSQIVRIIKNRFGQLMPYIRRFLAHLVAFWGGVTYIRRALSAFVRVLNKDERVRELLERVGWASASTLRVFLSIVSMLFAATLQFYHLMRDKVIPDTRRVIPIIYYKAIVRLVHVARKSPWSLFLGPFSLTFAIDENKIPDRYYLHEKLSVPAEDVTFASFHDIVESVRHTVYRTRSMPRTEAMAESEHVMETEYVAETEYVPAEEEEETEHREMQEQEIDDVETENSTPVYTQVTDETPVPPLTPYEDLKYRRSSRGHRAKGHRDSFPLNEMTNDDSGWHN